VLQIHAKTLKTFKDKVRILTNRNCGIAMRKQIHKLNLYLQGWGNYFLIAKGYQLTIELDHWIHRRLRMYFSSTSAATMAKATDESEIIDQTGCQ